MTLRMTREMRKKARRQRGRQGCLCNRDSGKKEWSREETRETIKYRNYITRIP